MNVDISPQPKTHTQPQWDYIKSLATSSFHCLLKILFGRKHGGYFFIDFLFYFHSYNFWKSLNQVSRSNRIELTIFWDRKIWIEHGPCYQWLSEVDDLNAFSAFSWNGFCTAIKKDLAFQGCGHSELFGLKRWLRNWKKSWWIKIHFE